MKDQVREFLTSRRANVTPDQVGLRSYGQRRVPGLRREEVAQLAGVSLDYYTRLERGDLRGASTSVLEAIARALLLDDAEREHLFDLARGAPSASRHGSNGASSAVRPSVRRVLDQVLAPAIVYDARQDIVAANAAGRALYSLHFEAVDTPNIVRFVFLDPRARDFYVDWPLARRLTSAMLRLEAGRDPLNREITELIGELSTRSPRFREDWAGHDVHQHTTGTKAFRHPEVGLLEVVFDVFELPGEPGLQLVTYSAAPETDTADALALLASWAPPDDAVTASHVAERREREPDAPIDDSEPSRAQRRARS